MGEGSQRERTLSEFREGLSAGTEDLSQFCRDPINYLRKHGYSTKGLPAGTQSLDTNSVKAATSAKGLRALLRERELSKENVRDSETSIQSRSEKEKKKQVSGAPQNDVRASTEEAETLTPRPERQRDSETSTQSRSEKEKKKLVSGAPQNDVRASTEKAITLAPSPEGQRDFSATESFPAVILKRTGHEPVESFRGAAMESAAITDGRGLPLREFRETFQRRRTDCARRRQRESAELRRRGPPSPVMERLPDASLAQNAISQRMIVGEPEPGSMVAESIILQDDRVQITDTTTHPYRWLCRLEITAATGARWLGTGWLAAPGLIVTAGHCVYVHNHGGWVSNVAVHVGQNGSQIHRSTASTYFASSLGWVQDRDSRYDYGAIFVARSDDGYFGYGVLSNELLAGAVANISGYPQDKSPGTMWGHAKQLLPPQPATLRYEIDTFGGMSGAPVFLWDGRDYVVAGIHNYGDVAANKATRITPEIFSNLERWKTF